MPSKVQRKQVLAEAMQRLIEFHKYSRQKAWNGGMIQDSDAQRLQDELVSLFSGLYECVEVDKLSEVRLSERGSASEDIEEVFEAAKACPLAVSAKEYAPPGTDVVLNLYPDDDGLLHEELWMSGRAIPFRIRYDDLDEFNRTMEHFRLSLIASHKKWQELYFSGEESPEEKVQFPIVETFSKSRTDPYVGKKLGYYELEHHFKSITKYKVLAGSESGEVYLLTTDSADLPSDAEEREVVSVFSGVWCDLKSFAESLLVTYYDHWKSFVRVRPCKECGELRMPSRVHPTRDGFCDEYCKNRWHLNNRYSNCRRRHNDAMERHQGKSSKNLKPYLLLYDDCAAANCSDEQKDKKGFHCMVAVKKNCDYLLSIVDTDKKFALKSDMVSALKKFRK